MTTPTILRVVWSDENMGDCETMYYVPPAISDAVVEDGADLMLALSVANRSAVTREVNIVEPLYAAGGTGTWGTNRDFVRLSFQTATGGTLALNVNAPKDAIILSGDILDETDTDVAALIAWALANVVTSTGVALVEYAGGVRWRKDE